MGTITRSHSFVSAEKPTEDQWNVDIDQLFSLANGNLDASNVDITSGDGIMTLDSAQTVTGTKTFNSIGAETVIKSVVNGAASVIEALTLDWDPANNADMTDNSSGIAMRFRMKDDAENQDDFAGIVAMVVSDATGAEEGELSFQLMKSGSANTELMTLAPTTGLALGVSGTGYDVVFHSATSGDNLTWDASEEVLQITGTNGQTSLDVLDGDVRIVDKLYFYDRGGEYLSSDGSTLTITGAIAASSTFETTGAATLASLVCTAAGTFGGGYGATGATISTAGVIQANGAITSDGAVTGATLAGTVSTAAQNSITAATSLASVGTITSGTWQSTAVASAYLDADTAHLGVTQTFTGAKTFTNTVTVGVDDAGHDVKIFGNAAGAYMEWDTSADQLRIMGASADAVTSTGKLLLATSLTNINANDVLGKIDFQAPHEAGGTDAITIAASIQAIAQGTFAADLNATDLIFYTGHSEAATEKFRMTSQGEIGIGGANYGTDGYVLTSGGAGAAVAWEATSTGTDCKFGVYHSAGTANVTGDGTAFTMTYQTEVFDTGNDFASNTFTAPVTGQYLFTCMVSLIGVLAAHTDGRIEIVTTQGDQMKIFAAGKVFESNTIVRPHISAIMDMDAGDTAYIRLTVYNAAKVVDLQNTYLSNQFSGAIQ